VYPLGALLERGYTPVRFRGLAEDETIVSASAYHEEAPGKSSEKASNKASTKVSNKASKKPHAAKR
jgi:hypothetical protein